MDNNNKLKTIKEIKDARKCSQNTISGEFQFSPLQLAAVNVIESLKLILGSKNLLSDVRDYIINEIAKLSPLLQRRLDCQLI